MKFFNFFKKSNRFVILTLVVVIQLASWKIILADYMQSGTYKIQSDSLNFGGVNSSSSSYKMNDTLGEVATGDSNSSSYYMHAGYWQMGESSLAISSPTDLSLSSIGGILGEGTEGAVSWNVMTDNVAGYSVSISSSTTPALKSSNDSFADYVPAGANPDYNFTNLPANSSFGFSPEGTEVISRFKDNGSSCNVGVLETSGKCWDGLSTTPKDFAGSTTPNMPSGASSTVRFRAESGSNHIQTSGAYSATITVTAITL